MTIERSAQFEGMEYSHEYWERHSKGSTYRGLMVEARHPEYGRIGEMALDTEPDEQGRREIHDIGVMLKGHGVGTGMWEYAHAAGLKPKHSAERTEEGERWAKHVGGDLPPRIPR